MDKPDSTSVSFALNPGHPMPFRGMSKDERAKAMVQVVDRVMDGDTIEQQAEEFGVTKHRLYQLLAEHAQDEWKSAQIARALMNLDEAEDKLKHAIDMVDVSAAQARIRSAQWQLERLWRRIFGADQPANMGQQVNIQINIERDVQAVAIGNATTVTDED